MTPAVFVAKWHANARNERAAAQEHFLDLCALLDEPTPNSDPTGATYAFEKGAPKASGGDGWADVWRRGRFAWEYKGKHRDLEAAHRQLLQYAGALENPPLLVTSDIERISIRTNWTNAVSERHELRLEELTQPARLGLLKSVFADPDRLRPGKTRAALTADAAAEFAGLAQRLRERGHQPQAVAHFVNRLVFCLFADDVDLLPPGLFERMLDAARKAPGRFEGYARRLFAAMADRGGEVDFTPVAWFNGGLFDDATALPLEAEDVAALQRAAALDWAEVDPSILGTLFERGLDPDKRSQLGAHYTAREMIERLIEPVVRRPLLEEWSAVHKEMAAALEAGTVARVGSRTKRDAASRAEVPFRKFLDRLRAFRVLDPACGSGNFLYLALLALKDIEHRAMVEAEALGVQREFPQVGPEAVLGIEVNPYAAELARVSVWIGHIQWARRHGYPSPSDPVLRRLDTIECRDAVLGDDGLPALWPAANVIVGNPPFLGDKAMIGVMGVDYTLRLRAAYAGRVPGGADLVCYWFDKAREALEARRISSVGLVATNSIRGGANRSVLASIVKIGSIFAAWPDEPWTLDGAAVRVSLVCFRVGHSGTVTYNDQAVTRILPDLTFGASDLSTARQLPENIGVWSVGTQKNGAFDIPGSTAREWLSLPANANGHNNSDVIKPWRNGLHITRRETDNWIVDFGSTMSEGDACFYVAPFSYLYKNVREFRHQLRRDSYKVNWWRHAESRPGLRKMLREYLRYIATPRVSKHRVFVWLDSAVLPDCQIVVIARDDDTTFGILHSRFHEVWSLRLGTALEDRPRYTPSTTFETFPFPDGLTPDRPAVAYANDPRAEAITAAARALVSARDRWLNPPELIERVPEVVPGFPDRVLPRDAAAEVILRRRTLTALYNTRGTPEGAWLDGLHQALDRAVAAAYGWPETIPDDDVLASLLALNQVRSSSGAPPLPSDASRVRSASGQ